MSLSELREAVLAWAVGFDPALYTTTDAARIVADASALEASMHTVKVLAAARAAEAETWKEGGYRSPAEALARQTGVSTGPAKDMLDTGRRLARQPDVARAGLGGRISGKQTSLIAQAAEADPQSAPRLIESAGDWSTTELHNEVARVIAHHTDREDRRQQIHRQRRVRTWTDIQGMWHLAAQGNPEDGAQIMAAVAPIQDEILSRARHQGEKESFDALAFDALVQLAKEAMDRQGPQRPGAGDGPTSGRRKRRLVARSKVLVRVDLDAMVRGYAVEGETCDIPGYGPIPVSAVRDMLASEDPFVAAIITKGKDVTGVAHLGRYPTSHQKSALEWLFPECTSLGCGGRVEEFDHRHDWAKTHRTYVPDMDGYCRRCHWLKTHLGWALVPGAGKRALVPPEDDRHPNHDPPRARDHQAV